MNKNLFLLPLMAVALYACSDSDSTSEAPSTVDTKAWTLNGNMDTTYAPGNNFFMYCNGTWYNKATPQDDGMVGLVMDALQLSNERVAKLDDPIINKFNADINTFNNNIEHGDSIIAVNTKVFEGITTKEEAYKAIGKALLMGYAPLVNIDLTPRKGITNLFITKYDDGVPRSLDATSNAAYLKHIGYSAAQSAEIAQNACNAYTKLSKLASGKSYSAADFINHPELTADLIPVSAMKTRSTGMDVIDGIISGMGIAENNVYLKESDLTYLATIQAMSADEIKSALIACVAVDAIFNSQKALDAYNLSHKTEKNIDKLATLTSEKYMNYIYSHAYSTKYISDERKAQLTAVCEELRSTFNDRISSLDWMSDATKAYAKEKLAAMKFNVGRPDTWYQEGLPTLTGTSFLEDVIQLRKAFYNFQIALIGKDAQEATFHNIIGSDNDSRLTAINSNYSRETNSMQIYPAFLLEPFYDTNQSDAYNYAIFSVIGHEMTHGFDSEGAIYDKMGDTYNWWTVSDKMEFDKRTQKLVNCYNHLEVTDGREELNNKYCDGTKTLAENMADLGGFNLAYQTYINKAVKDGYSGDELVKQEKKFYQAVGNLYRNKEGIATFLYAYQTDEHSRSKERVNGVVMNTDRWYELYNVKWGDKLYLKPEDRTYVW